MDMALKIVNTPILVPPYRSVLYCSQSLSIFFRTFTLAVTILVLSSLCCHADPELAYRDSLSSTDLENDRDFEDELATDNFIPTSNEVLLSSDSYDEVTSSDTTDSYVTDYIETESRSPVQNIPPSNLEMSESMKGKCAGIRDQKQKKDPNFKSDKKILDEILEETNYDKRILPDVSDDGPVNVTVDLLILSLASPDESSLKYEVEFLLSQQWEDSRLCYGDKYKYDHLNALHHVDQIWSPDTYFIMHGEFKEAEVKHFAMKIFRNGTISYTMRRHLILSCRGEVHRFPFDDPECEFSIESISHETPQLQYIWKDNKKTLRKSNSLSTLNAYIIYNATHPCIDNNNSWRGNYSCLQVDLRFSRDRTFYFTTVFIPGMILVTSSFVSFWLEWNAVPARSMIGVTTMLNFFTSSNSFRGKLPVVSNLTAMNIWDGACMCFIYMALLEFICVNYVGRKRPMGNVVYKPKEPKPTNTPPSKRSRFGSIFHLPLDTIEREFLVAISAEKPNQPNSIKKRSRFSRKKSKKESSGKIEEEPVPVVEVTSPSPKESPTEPSLLRPRKTGISASAIDLRSTIVPDKKDVIVQQTGDIEGGRSLPKVTINIPEDRKAFLQPAGSNPQPPNLVDLKQKEAAHPIRVAKTIDVVARISFPTAFFIFLVSFFNVYHKT